MPPSPLRRPINGPLTRTQVLYLRARGLRVTWDAQVCFLDGRLRLVDAGGRICPVDEDLLAQSAADWDAGGTVEYTVRLKPPPRASGA